MNILLSDVGVVSSLGHGKQQTWQNLFDTPQNSMTVESGWIADLDIAVGKVNHPLPDMTDWHGFDQSRCNQLAYLAYQQIEDKVTAAVEQYGAERVGVILGTSTSGTAEAEQAFAHLKEHQQLPASYHYNKQEMAAPANFVAKLAGIKGIVLSISTACSSGAKALISGSNMIKTGLVDAVIVGGVDSLCHLTLNGFYALESLSSEISNPFSVNRNGINIGEGAALFLMEKELMEKGQTGVALAGFGESSDAHHMSAPHPEGDGALAAMQSALDSAGLTAADLDYINLHGTSTQKNDAMEGAAVSRLGAKNVDCSSTKPFTGHTLAGAGAIEAAICWLIMSNINEDNRLPMHVYDEQFDDAIGSMKLVKKESAKQAKINYCLSNSFAFGGSNVSLLLARTHE